jgi:hypothetical protein
MRTKVQIRLLARSAVVAVVLAGVFFAVGRSPAQAATAQVTVYSPMFTVPGAEAGSAPRLFTAVCELGKLLSGGVDGANDGPLHVVYSYPSDIAGNPTANGGHPLAWTVGVINTDTKNHPLHVTAICLRGPPVVTTVATTTSSPTGGSFTLTTSCPAATARTGGGYSFAWSGTRSDNPTPTGSRPTGTRSWTVNVAYLTQVLRVYSGVKEKTIAVRGPIAYAVCISGTGPTETGEAHDLDFNNDPAVCTPSGGGLADVCTSYARQDLSCGNGLLPAGGGWQVTRGEMAGTYTMMTDMAGPDPAYHLAARVLTDDKDRFVVQAVSLCLKAVPVKATAASKAAVSHPADTQTPKQPSIDVKGQSHDLTTTAWFGIGGAGCLLLLVVAGLALYFMWRANLPQPQPVGPTAGLAKMPITPGPSAQRTTVAYLEVVVRDQRSAYRTRDLREIT